MLYKRSGYPEQDEILLCKVTKIYPNSVFVEMLEYGKQGMIHISEVSPGRIRNLRDYVSENRQIVCKVLRLDLEKGHIDLSLRRVNSNQRREKLEEIKTELKSESLIANLAKKLKLTTINLYKEITDKVFEEYSHLYLCFRDVVDGSANLEKLGLPKSIAKELTNAILDKFKPQKIVIKGEFSLQTYTSEGIDKIKSTLKEIEKVSLTINLSYLGAGRYKFFIEDFDYKPAENTLKKMQDILDKFGDKLSTTTFKREKSS